MNLLIMGAPGAGKGTMSDLVLKNYDIVHVSTGDMLRSAVKNGTPVGLKAKEYMDKGALVPDSIVEEIIAERLKEKDMEKGFLFDGYPRTLKQAMSLTYLLSKLNVKLDAVIDLEVDDEVLIRRITGRRLCPKCGSIYNVYYNEPKKDGYCDKCGEELLTRSDDNEESLKIRLEEYHKNTEPVINYYQNLGLVRSVNAVQDTMEVFEDIKEILEVIK